MQLTLPGLSAHPHADVLAGAVYALADALDAVYADPTAHPVLPAFPLEGPEADRARALYRHARRCVTGRGVPVRETDRLRLGKLGHMRRGRITIKREQNVRYVAFTRAKEALSFVGGPAPRG